MTAVLAPLRARVLRALTDPADWSLTVLILVAEVFLNALIIWRVPCAAVGAGGRWWRVFVCAWAFPGGGRSPAEARHGD